MKEILLTYIVQVTGEQMTSTFLTNVVGPLMLTKVGLLYQHLADNQPPGSVAPVRTGSTDSQPGLESYEGLKKAFKKMSM